jgi:hypothetical protein
MNIPPSEARNLTFYEYTALLCNWEKIHSTEVDIPKLTVEQLRAREAKMAAKGYKVH